MSSSFPNRLVAIVVIASLISVLGSCVSIDHRAHLRPITGDTPVSASAYFVDASGSVVGPSDYRVVDSFSIEQQLVGDFSTTHVVDVSAEIEALVARHGARAVVNLRVLGIGHDEGSYPVVGVSSAVALAGASLVIIFGTMVALYGDDADPMADPMTGFTLGAALVTLAGLAGWLLVPQEASWTLRIEGDIVR